MSVLLLFLLITGLLPVFADDYGQSLAQGSLEEIEKSELNKPEQKPDQLNKPAHKPDKLDKPGQKPDQLNKPGHKPDELNKPAHKPDKLNKPGHKPDELNKPAHKPDKLDKPGQKPDQLNKPESRADKPKAGDISLQISNETDSALFVRASIVDASERVNLAKAKSVSLAAHTRESVVLTPMNAGKVSLAPMNSKAEVSNDSKILLTINRGKETRRLVIGYAKSAGIIALSKDLFPQAHEKSPRSKLPAPSEEVEKHQQKPTSSTKGQIVYVINQTGASVNYNALLKPANFDPLQGELKPGTNVLKFSAKKTSHSLSKGQISLILQMKYDFPGSPTVTFKKEAFDLDSHPTVVLTRATMGEPTGQIMTPKKPK
ncbi:MAG: hypothetical protein EOM80_10595 [Erysipelotrichia bacterium]|nr:hypothetical protein [Erysipelotrichia bacterium]